MGFDNHARRSTQPYFLDIHTPYQVSGRKPDTFQLKMVPSISQRKVTSPKSMSETNILTNILEQEFKGLTTTRCESTIYLYHPNFW